MNIIAKNAVKCLEVKAGVIKFYRYDDPIPLNVKWQPQILGTIVHSGIEIPDMSFGLGDGWYAVNGFKAVEVELSRFLHSAAHFNLTR